MSRGADTPMQQEILSASPLLSAAGTLVQPGWARQPLWQYQRTAIRAAGWRIKEWDYYAVLSAEQRFGIALTVADLGYVGLVALCYLDFARGSFQQVDSLIPLPLGRLGLGADSQHGRLQHHSRTLQVDIEVDHGQRRLRFAAPGLRAADGSRGLEGEILLQPPSVLESLNIATSWAENRRAFYYNRKLNCLPASGQVRLGTETRTFDPSRDAGVLDWGRGVWTYQNRWYWSSASGFLDGVPFGFNLGYGFSDRSPASENALIHAGRLHKLGEVHFAYDAADYLKPWRLNDDAGRLELSFRPLLDRHSKIDLGLMKTVQHQVFGLFSGRVLLDDGTPLQLDEFLGFAEEVFNRW
ncbi:DUF2804 domain-containing protein [Pseudomonas sp. UL073]|uniref:DUF2804 domain-containing protein n=1 Tax=Zestomonas insulae TaxID=2809017 RepID=A0ABS2IMJ6_9GAMM|nr:DUF2804 domain-containing protein [Pseudomonas insulae]MBM7063217.1 DUF2804 domain-containing protein [Pseudomonas insulae]